MECERNKTLSEEHLSALREIFSRFDVDADGTLTKAELGALLRSLGLKPSRDQIEQLIKGVDANGNGGIEFTELVALVAPGGTISEDVSCNQEGLLALFRSFDRDGNGFITAAELAHSMAKLGHPLSFRELTEMFSQADADGDGLISFAEFAAAVTSASVDYLKASLN